MSDRHEKHQGDPVDLVVKARDVRNATLRQALHSLSGVPKTVFPKCYLEPLNRGAAEKVKPNNDPAENPLNLRGLDAR